MDKIRRLWRPVERNDTAAITRLVRRGFDVNSRDTMGRTILHYAASLPTTTRAIEHLVNLGADVNARDITQKTPLHWAMLDESIEDMTDMIMRSKFPLLSINYRDELLECSENRKLIVKDLVEKERLKMVDCLLKLGADINAKCNHSTTSLFEAIRTQNVQAVKVLARLAGADLTNQRIRSKTVLFLAMEFGEKEIMKHLVKSGADVNDVTRSSSALNAAVQSGNVEIVQTLLEHGANVEESFTVCFTTVSQQVLYRDSSDLGIYTCLAHLGADFNAPGVKMNSLYEATLLDTPDVLNFLVGCGVNINQSRSDAEHTSPVILALQSKQFQVLEHLVQCGADINSRYTCAVDTLTMIARKGNVEMATALVRHGFPIDQIWFSKGNAVFHLVSECHFKSQKLHDLIEQLNVLARLGVNLSVKDEGYNALYDAVSRGDVNMVKVLVNLGADVNTLGERGLTPLNVYLKSVGSHLQESAENVLQWLSCLLDLGADVNAGVDRITPLFLAVEQSDTRMIETLCALGANMDQLAYKQQLNPLIRACNLDRPDILDCLIEHGADVNAECVTCMLPLLEAVTNGDTEMVQCLLKCGANPNIGPGCQRSSVLHTAMQGVNDNAFNCLIKAPVKIHNKVLYGNIHLNEKAKKLAERFGIIIPQRTLTLACAGLLWEVDSNIFQTLLSLGANAPHEVNIEELDVTQNYMIPPFKYWGGTERDYVYSNLHAACNHGDLDMVRMLIIDGSDVNDIDSYGKQPFDLLPLALFVDYHALHETKTTEKVVKRAGQDFSPFLPVTRIDSLLCILGEGDVRSFAYPNCAQIGEDVERFIAELVNRCKSPSKLWNCGSAAEGTKVGLPDEMDFLAEIGQLGESGQGHLKDGGHDYVHYIDETKNKFMQGSKTFHENFAAKLMAAVVKFNKQSSEYGDLRVLTEGRYRPITDSSRKATSPLQILWERRYGNYIISVGISVDVVPSIHVDGWPAGGVQKTWLLSHVELQKHGYFIVPKPPHVQSDLAKEYSQEDLQTLWKISFPHLETYHMQHLEKRVKDVYLLAKCLRNPDVCRIMVTDMGSYPKNVDKYITSYMLKMIFFKNVEDFLRSDLSLGEMVCRVYDGVEEGLSKEFIPLYFMPKVSALGGHKLNISKCARVARIMKKFVHALYLRDCRQDPCEIEDLDEVIVFQRKPTSVYRCIEIASQKEMLKKRLWDCE